MMNLKCESVFSLRRICSRRVILSFVSLLFVLMLLSSNVYAATFNAVSPASAYNVDDIVNDEQGLRDAITEALDIAPVQYVIALAKDIVLTGSTLTIPATANVVLISDGGTSMKLIGPNDMDTITIEDAGELVLDGVIVTHDSGETGRGVYVNFGAKLTLISGEISENNIYTVGIINDATFGGGVYNLGTFIMNGGTFCKNSAYNGGGVYNAGPNALFNMVGGIIGVGDSSNVGNSAYNGGGVYNAGGTFTMSGNAAILGNRATFGGGVYNAGGTFDMGDPISSEVVSISGNTATSNGGGVYTVGATAIFNMYSNAVLSGRVLTK